MPPVPTEIYSIDFETFSWVDIKKGLPKYVEGCSPICMAYRVLGDESTPQLWLPGDALPRELFHHVLAGGKVAAWNALFEWYIWNHVVTTWYKPTPPLKFEQLIDTMAMAAAVALPQSLGKCGEVLGLSGDAAKDHRGKVLIKRCCVPQRPTRLHPEPWRREDPDDLAELYAYCQQDVVAEQEIMKRLPWLSDLEQAVWVLTQKMNTTGIPVAVDECEVIKSVVHGEQAYLNNEMRRVTDGAVKAVSNVRDLMNWINDKHPEIEHA